LKPIARRAHKHAAHAQSYEAQDDEAAPAPAPAPSSSGDDYVPSYAAVIAPSYATPLRFGGFGHRGHWSDKRLKRDICRVGATASGIPLYTFRYRWSNVWYVGAMAQDLLTLKPAAVSKVGAYYQVDYSRIDAPFEPIARPAPCAAGA
jgi:hypothetical protein